jgi:hypothetical protein
MKDPEILINSTEGVPVFKTPEEYQEFRDYYTEEVGPQLEKLRLARLGSEHAAMSRIVD